MGLTDWLAKKRHWYKLGGFGEILELLEPNTITSGIWYFGPRDPLF